MSSNSDSSSRDGAATVPSLVATNGSIRQNRKSSTVMLLAIALVLNSFLASSKLGSFFPPSNDVVGQLGDQRSVTLSIPMQGTGSGFKPCNETDHAASTVLEPKGKDWFVKEKWESNDVLADACPFVENVCFQQRQWFYDSSIRKQAHERHGLTILDNPRQPNIGVVFGAKRGNSGNAYPRSFHIAKSMILPPGFNLSLDSAMDQCSYSPVANHMILNGEYTDMLGEFYLRVYFLFIRLQTIIADTMVPNVDILNETAEQKKLRHDRFRKQFAWQTQLYLSLGLGTRASVLGLLESHQLFLQTLTVNPVSALRVLFDDTRCQCVQRMFFCGFSARPEEPSILKERDHILKPEAIGKKRGKPLIMAEGRDLLRSQVIDNVPSAAAQINQKRLEHLEASGLKPTEVGNHSDYKIIGLAQRVVRRRWLNMDECKKACNARLKQFKIRCIEVNLEVSTMASPVQHLTTHAALDGLIGVHGAQLTEALLMPPGSLVVELLPWVLEGLKQGRWTNTASSPTPVGVMFTETDLNHIGYPLNKSSTDYIECPKNLTDIRDCYRNALKRWDSRSFTVDPDVVVDLLAKFVSSPSTMTCNDYDTAAGNDYVLYNVVCANKTESPTVHHFYRAKTWVDERAQSAIRFYNNNTI